MPDSYFDRALVTHTQKFNEESTNQKKYQDIIAKCRPKGSYEGEKKNGMKHGVGKLSWTNGEVYEGEFFKDYSHGEGKYIWSDGSTFTGRFYLGKKEGYGKMTFCNGDWFEGVYANNERFGPGIYHYEKSGKEDIGLWQREKLIQLRTELDDVFTINDHLEYEYYPDEHLAHINMCEGEPNTMFSDLTAATSSELFFVTRGFRSRVLIEENTLPIGIEKYTEDFEHLPITENLKTELDKSFFHDDYNLVKNDSDALILANNNTKLLMDIQKNAYKHRHQIKDEHNLVLKVLQSSRSDFSSVKGPVEIASESLINAAEVGDGKTVYSCLRANGVNPNVCDQNGTTALFAAAINCHKEIVNLLLDMGANIDHLTNEGLTALTACHIFYYPVDHFKNNIAESYISDHKLGLMVMEKKKKKEERAQSRSGQRRREANERRKAMSHPAAFQGYVSPTMRNPLLPKKKKTPPTSAISGRTDFSKLSDLRDMDKNEAVDLCKSDLKIKALHRELTLSRAESRSHKHADDNMSITSSDGGGSMMTPSEKAEKEDDEMSTSTEIASSNISSISHRNMVEYDIIVPEELIEHTATLLSFNKRAVSGMSTRDGRAISLGTTGALAVWKAEHQELRDMIQLLLNRGADPNRSNIPFPPLIFAIKAADTEAVRFLLEHGANTTTRLSTQLGGFTPLHIACAIPGTEGVECVDLLLKAGANPNDTAYDQEVIAKECVNKTASNSTSSSQSMATAELMSTHWVTTGQRLVEEEGRTPLHIASDRDDDYKLSAQVVHLLLDAGANPDVIWSGHSPLSLAIKSGNDFAVNELLQFDADASLPLLRGVGSALCAASNPLYEEKRTPENRIKLINRLIEAGANILAPIVFGTKLLTGTVVDYAHWMFSRDMRIAHTPYHALTYQERDTYNARKTLLSHLGMLIRNAALKVERHRLQEEKNLGIRTKVILQKLWFELEQKERQKVKFTPSELAIESVEDLQIEDSEEEERLVVGFEGVSPSRGSRFLFTGAGATPSRGTTRDSTHRPGAVSRVSFVPTSLQDEENVPQDQQSSINGLPVSSTIGERRQPIKGRKGTGPIRKPLFRYCYECGRSVGVRLTACSRCHEVYYCSRSCKLKAWESRHKKECLRQKTSNDPISPSPSELASYFTPRTVKETITAAKSKDHVIETRKRVKSSQTTLPDINSNTSSSPRYHSRIKSSKSTKTFASDGTSTVKTSKHHKVANVNRTLRNKLGKHITFGTTGMTLKELGITDNYTFI